MGLDHHKGVDCTIPFSGESESFPFCHPYRDPPVKVSVTITELRGLMFYDH